MSNSEQDGDETPAQRALRMRKSAQAAKPKPPGTGKVPKASASGVAAGASRPAMKR